MNILNLALIIDHPVYYEIIETNEKLINEYVCASFLVKSSLSSPWSIQ